jgi:di/tricarboxylate transporter
MTPEAWFTAALVLGMLAVLAFTRAAPDFVFMAAVVVLLLTGIVSPQQAFAGFSNQGVITVAALYVVVAGLRETGGVQWIVQSLLGRPRSLRRAVAKLTGPVAFFSAFLNNTPVVGMLIPAVSEWARKFNLPVSRLMMPLSFAAILGGTVTIIGTSTNLVVNGLLIDRTGQGLGLFDIAWVGIPVTLAGLAVMVVFNRQLFPDRRPAIAETDDPREYSLEMIVAPGGPLIGKTIEEVGLRHLAGGFLMELERGDTRIPAVSPKERLQSGDHLIFVGVVESMADLQRIRGLLPATNQIFKLDGHRSDRALVEVVVSGTCPVAGMTVRDGAFRNRYNAVVIAVARNGERLREKIGDITLRAGDTLLVEAGSSFLDHNRNRRDFFLVSQVQGSAAPRHDRALLAAGILLAMVASASLGLLTMLEATLAASGLMILTRCVSLFGARTSLDWSVLLTIAAAFGVAAALDNTSLAQTLAWGLTSLGGTSPGINLLMLYVATALFTALITNNAAAVLMFPIGFAVASDLGVSVLPFAITIMFAAFASFATPFGYETNLMVYGPGGYRFSDYLRAGIPLTLVSGAVALALIPLVWDW